MFLSSSPLRKLVCVPGLVEIDPLALDKKPFKCCHCIFPLEDNGPHLNKLGFPLLKYALCTV